MIFDKNNLHHAYLIEGRREEVMSEILEFMQTLGVETSGNADFSHIAVDSLKIDDARNLKALAAEKGYTSKKRVFIISANNFLLEAQNTLLKMFEEPIENTIFFLVVPDKNALLRTLVSRFYVVSSGQDSGVGAKDAEDFIKLSLHGRLDYIKGLLAEEDDEEIVEDSPKSKALKFLNALEAELHKKLVMENFFDATLFEHIFKVRKFLRMPGSSAKSLMESVALIIPQ